MRCILVRVSLESAASSEAEGDVDLCGGSVVGRVSIAGCCEPAIVTIDVSSVTCQW